MFDKHGKIWNRTPGVVLFWEGSNVEVIFEGVRYLDFSSVSNTSKIHLFDLYIKVNLPVFFKSYP